MTSSVRWLSVLELVWNKCSNSSIFFWFSIAGTCCFRQRFGQSQDPIDVIVEVGRIAAGRLLLTVNKNWSASMVARELSLQNCFWFMECDLPLFFWGSPRWAIKDFFLNARHHVVGVMWAKNLSCFSLRTLTSGWGTTWGSSIFLPRFLLSIFHVVSAEDPGWPSGFGFSGNSSCRESEPRAPPSVLLSSFVLGFFLGYLTFWVLRDSSNTILLWFGETCVLIQVVPGIFVTSLLVTGCRFSPTNESCHWKQVTRLKSVLTLRKFLGTTNDEKLASVRNV